MHHSVQEYVILALGLITLIQFTSVMLVRRGRSVCIFQASSGISVALACICTLLARRTFFPRQIVCTVFMTIWGVRLSAYLYTRSFVHESINPGSRIVWSLLCALPTIILNTHQFARGTPSAVEYFWCIIALLSIAFETIADYQKQQWHKAHSDARPTRIDIETPVCSNGLWAHSRHPNLFGELLFHFAIVCIILPVEHLFVICPFLCLAVLIILLPGGILSSESSRNTLYKSFPSYQQYKKNTPVLFPLRGMYTAMAPCSRKMLCLELQIYNIDSNV